MAKYERLTYSPLPPASPAGQTRRGAGRFPTCQFSFVNVAVLLCSALLGFFGGWYIYESKMCRACLLRPWSNEFGALQRFPRRFDGSLSFVNRFRGPPSPEIDREWDRFTHHPLIDGTASLISVSLDDIKRANKTSDSDWLNSTVQYGDVNGGGYMATLEMFHQLHCLNMLRKAIHREYYEEMKPSKNGSRTEKLTTHLDHCIEILRQVVTCYGDIGLITFHWVEGNPVPYPDFNTWHQCMDPEAILKWAEKREAPIAVKVEKALFGYVVEMPVAP